MTKVMAKEIAPFNVRTLTVILGGFRTDMGNKVRAGSIELADDYKNTVVGETLQYMHGGHFVGDGDPVKAARVIYEVVVGEGVGEGKGSELDLPLGIELESRIQMCRDRLDHSWDVFGDVATNVRHVAGT